MSLHHWTGVVISLWDKPGLSGIYFYIFPCTHAKKVNLFQRKASWFLLKIGVINNSIKCVF